MRSGRIVVAKRFDQDVLGRVVQTARPVVPQAARLAAARFGDGPGDVGPLLASSGRTRNFAVMKIKACLLKQSSSTLGSRERAPDGCAGC